METFQGEEVLQDHSSRTLGNHIVNIGNDCVDNDKSHRDMERYYSTPSLMMGRLKGD